MAGLQAFMAKAGVDFELTPLAEIADFVLSGIREQRFWLIPEGENTDQTIRNRAESMIARDEPQYMIQARELVVGGMGGETQT